jgi:hypothetical protein
MAGGRDPSLDRTAQSRDETAVSVLDGQTRPAFILPHVTTAVATCRIVLLDCTPAVRATRLRDGRSQPELVTERMETWATFLRREAGAHGLPIIETSQLSIDAVADALQHEVDLLF